MTDIMFAEYLKHFGLTGQEAAIYELLLKNQAMTGYEVAKESGISRSNVYSSLAGLVDKGAAYQIDGNPQKYVSVDMKKFCSNTLRELSRMSEYLISHAPEKEESGEGYLTIRGSRHIRDMIREMLENCEKRVYLLADESLIMDYKEQIDALIAEDKKVVIMSTASVTEGAIWYNTRPDPDQVRLITDSSYVLTGQLRDADDDTCLYSGQKNLVSVMKEALQNRIKLITLNLQEEDEKQ